MGSSPSVSAEFSAAFLTKAGSGGVMTFADFMELALYHPEFGYYRRSRPRVGYARGTDFYTATSSGRIFGELIAAACVKLLGGEAIAREHTFVEIGAEPSGGALTAVDHPFAAVRTVRVGEDLRLNGHCVVFSNELFDAQPIRRFVRRGSDWKELGVALRDDTLTEIEGDIVTAPWLPLEASEGYVFDAPRASETLAAQIAAQPWTGLFVAFDYGKSLGEIATCCPAGTVRAYFQHTQSNNLLAQPGEQDLTGHVCWDWLAEALARTAFIQPIVESQEAFFIHHAGAFLAKAMTEEAAGTSQRKRALMQLLHPSHMGQKFQVLHARR
jgi:SAM-dependent MidA family methyltransferase